MAETNSTEKKSFKGQRGGARPGAGRKKGKYSQKTLDKMRVKQAMDQSYMRMSKELVNAQARLALGQTFLYKIEKREVVGPKGGVSYENQKPELVTSPSEIEDYLAELSENNGDLSDEKDPSETYYFLTTKEPNNEALKDIFNRIHGKPKESIEHSGEVSFSLVELARRRDMMK